MNKEVRFKRERERNKRNILKIFKDNILIKWLGVKGDKQIFISLHPPGHQACTLKIKRSLK